MTRLSHLDATGAANMVDVSDKEATERTARAEGRVVMQPENVEGGLSNVLILEGLAMHGNSGSPVVGMDGKVVGTIFARAPGFAYAVPVQPYLVTLLRTVSPRRTWP